MKDFDETVDIIGTHVSKDELIETLELFRDTIHSNEKRRVSVVPVNCILWKKIVII